jgi:rhodanese-related sulfurtransferase
MEKLHSNIFFNINIINEKISHLEGTIARLEEKLAEQTSIQRSHIIRVKNHEDISDDAIYYGNPYNDLSPHKAYKAYSNKDFNFILIDVSEKDFSANVNFEESIKIPLEELEEKSHIHLDKKIPIFVISEDGIRSILACDLLVELGYYNVTNISGGHRFWPGARYKADQPPSLPKAANS